MIINPQANYLSFINQLIENKINSSEQLSKLIYPDDDDRILSPLELLNTNSTETVDSHKTTQSPKSLVSLCTNVIVKNQDSLTVLSKAIPKEIQLSFDQNLENFPDKIKARIHSSYSVTMQNDINILKKSNLYSLFSTRILLTSPEDVLLKHIFSETTKILTKEEIANVISFKRVIQPLLKHNITKMHRIVELVIKIASDILNNFLFQIVVGGYAFLKIYRVTIQIRDLIKRTYIPLAVQAFVKYTPIKVIKIGNFAYNQYWKILFISLLSTVIAPNSPLTKVFYYSFKILELPQVLTLELSSLVFKIPIKMAKYSYQTTQYSGKHLETQVGKIEAIRIERELKEACEMWITTIKTQRAEALQDAQNWALTYI